MNLTKKITLALGLLTASVSIAQTISSSAQGVLGQSYTEFGFGMQDIKHVSPNLYTLGLSANRPLSPNVDVGASYAYDWIKSAAVRGHANTIGANATAYTALQGVKAFAGAGLGWQWSHVGGSRDNNGLWDLNVGVEVPVGAFTLTPRIVYHDDFESRKNSNQDLTYEVGGNYWVTKTTAAFASIGYSDVRLSSADTWNYRIGLRVRY